MKTIDKIVKSDVAPKQTGVLWLNTNDGKLYSFDGKKGWVPEFDAEAVSEVETLPEIKGNEDKFFRNKEDNNVYVATMTSRTLTTNRLPDEQQIDKAYVYLADDVPYYYKGAYKIICTDGEIDGYGWLEKYDNGDSWYFILTKDNAVNVTADSECIIISYEDADEIDEVNKIVIMDDDKADWDFADDTLSIEELIPISAIYNAPESAQIGNATLKDFTNGERCVYNGTQISLEHGGKQITGYGWTCLDSTAFVYVTDKPASEIYFYYDEDNDVYYTDTKLWYAPVSDYTDAALDEGFETLYIPQLNAPDSEQVGNAYITNDDGDNVTTYTYNYTDVIKTIVVSDGELYIYIWGEYSDVTWMVDCKCTTVPANEIYSNNQIIEIGALEDYEWSISGDTITNLEISLADLEENNISSLIDSNDSVSTVKYQRTETIEEWEWKELAVKEDPEIIEIHNDDEWYKLDGFTTPGVYNNIKLFVSNYMNEGDESILFPATLTVSTDTAGCVGQLIQYTIIQPTEDSYFIYLMRRTYVEEVWQNPDHTDTLYEI